MNNKCRLDEFFQRPEGCGFYGGFLSTYGVECELVSKTIWPALFGEVPATQLEKSSQRNSAWIIVDQAEHQNKPMAVGGWPILYPLKGTQHSKVWLLAFADFKTLEIVEVRLAVGSHNLTMASFISQMECHLHLKYTIGAARRPDKDTRQFVWEACLFFEQLLKACDLSRGGGRRVEKALLRLRQISSVFNPGKQINRKRKLMFVGSSLASAANIAEPKSEGDASSLFNMIEKSLQKSLAMISAKQHPLQSVLITPFFDQQKLDGGSRGASIMERFTRNAPSVVLIGPAEEWRRGEASDRWMRANQATGRLRLRKPGPADERRKLHAKCMAWLYESTGVLYMGSGNLTHHGMLIPPPVGNYEAGALIVATRREVQRWIHNEFAPTDPPDNLGDVVAPEHEERNLNLPCPIYEILVQGQPSRLEIQWLNEQRPVEWSLESKDKTIALNQDSDSTQFAAPESLSDTLTFRADGKIWSVPVVNAQGMPVVYSAAITYDEAVASYRRGLLFAQSATSDENIDAENSSTIAHGNGESSAEKEALAYAIRTYAEEMHVFLEHTRRLPCQDFDSWFREDLPRLIQQLRKKPQIGTLLAKELWRVVSKEAKPFEKDAMDAWLAAVQSVKADIIKLIACENETPTGSQTGNSSIAGNTSQDAALDSGPHLDAMGKKATAGVSGTAGVGESAPVEGGVRQAVSPNYPPIQLSEEYNV